MANQLEFNDDLQRDDSQSLQALVQNPEGDLHLSFFLESGGEFALPAMGIREVLALASDQITPIPNVSPFLLGVLNLRGEAVWVADIGQFLGEPKPISIDHAELPIIIIEAEDTMLGLAVASVKGMQWLESHLLSPVENLAPELAPFVVGEWRVSVVSSLESPLQLLEPASILRSERWVA
ncbi:chemotaxis protein CheW [Lyngbya confervoides]|uniref:Chemotaxis protein CheW n=1 Tax=Lyngbya confervoides BDU141951 TaxID=1574623 RepID=A0ABD4T998_9CYAN|nr:chemotaxis protein CheW [Lyngbya confervoides]MCM1985186.1 chemotaxis protein CheW [Lyngbya confervoides BDU141951]